jgi:hypothetical protein
MVAQLANFGDRVYIASAVSLLDSAARTATTNGVVQSDNVAATFVAKGAHIILDVTAIVAAPSIVLHMQGFEGSGAVLFYDLLVSVPIIAIGTYVLKIYPGILAVPNLSANDLLPDQWRIAVIHDNANSITYSVGAKLFS